MADQRQAIIRHAKHYVGLAQEYRADWSQMTAELANLKQAGDFCIQLTNWNLLVGLTDAINDYLLRHGHWFDFIKLNTPLVKSDLTEQPEARIERVLQLIELEENRGNFPQVLDWNKFLVELYQKEKNQSGVIIALKRIAQLSQRDGRDSDVEKFLEEGLRLARDFGDRKHEIDFLYEFALLYKKRKEFEKSQGVCERAISLALSIEYVVAELDLITLMASLFVTNDQNRALSLYQQALTIAIRLSDIERQVRLQGEIKRLEELVAAEREKQRKVFISYTHHDRKFAERLASDLKKHGLPVWWDEWEIRVGESIIQRVNDGIDSSAYLVAALSTHSVHSDFVRREIGSALMKQLSAEKDIVVLPLLVNDCEVPVLLREIKWADFRNDYADGLKMLLKRLLDSVTHL